MADKIIAIASLGVGIACTYILAQEAPIPAAPASKLFPKEITAEWSGIVSLVQLANDRYNEAKAKRELTEAQSRIGPAFQKMETFCGVMQVAFNSQGQPDHCEGKPEEKKQDPTAKKK